MNGLGGQSSAIAQELCKDWVDEAGRTHPGIYDENNPDMQRWVESYPHAVSGCLKLVEPRKYRNAMFEAAKTLVPMGCIKFPPACPKSDIIVLDNGISIKLNKPEQQSLIQMDLMKEEIASMVRCKTVKGFITYQLPVEKRNKMHDDRAYVFMMAAWWLYQLRTEEFSMESEGLDYGIIFNKEHISKQSSDSENQWIAYFRDVKPNKLISPFKGDSPFKKDGW